MQLGGMPTTLLCHVCCRRLERFISPVNIGELADMSQLTNVL